MSKPYECEHKGCGENFPSDQAWEEARAVIIVNGWDRDNMLIRLPGHEDGKTVLAADVGWIVVQEREFDEDYADGTGQGRITPEGWVEL